MTPGRATCDTSVVVPAFLTWHEHHEVARRAVTEEVVAVPAHVIAETFSVVTRLPAPHRVAPDSVLAFLDKLPGPAIGLSPERYLPTLARLAAYRITGGSIYDGLIAATAVEHGLTLLTLDRRAGLAYDAMGAQVRRPAT